MLQFYVNFHGGCTRHINAVHHFACHRVMQYSSEGLTEVTPYICSAFKKSFIIWRFVNLAVPYCLCMLAQYGIALGNTCE
mmetsp:Transcript_70875/g.117756  ORF Transcript_70875/g.117756 Transcript_70875/m.117756 type:complete len:80 (+) Transcript_70875:636-875(+)